nr:fibronectin type III domain-containing protein [Candidatus Nanopelagicales bacterium]
GVLNGRSVTTVRLGKRFTCALADAKPFCWGDNGNGQLGVGVVGTPPYSTVPVAVSMPTQVADEPVTALTAGENFTCMIAQGRPFCWGLNTSGQLGDGSFTSKPDPVAVDATGALLGKQARTFSAGFGHMVFLAQQVPTAPREVTASVNGTEATVSWQPPTDDGGRAVMGYRVSGGGSGCESTGSACTVSGLAPGAEITLNVVARNGVGDSVPATVNVTTSPAPAVVKVKQSFAAPKRLKKSGVTVVAAKGARTSAGQPVTTKVKTKGKVKVLRKGGAVKVRSFGKKGWRVTLTQTAPGTDTVEPFSQRVVYVNGKRR